MFDSDVTICKNKHFCYVRMRCIRGNMFKHTVKCNSIEDCKTVRWYLGRILTVISPEYSEIDNTELTVVTKQKVYMPVIDFLQNKYKFEVVQVNEETKEN